MTLVDVTPFNLQLATFNLYLYSGEQFDPDLGLYYHRARYLEPDRGRFWTMDSWEGFSQDPASLHKYLYVHADPVNGIDPAGNQTLTLTELSYCSGYVGYYRATISAPQAIRAFKVGVFVAFVYWTIEQERAKQLFNRPLKDPPWGDRPGQWEEPPPPIPPWWASLLQLIQHLLGGDWD